MESYLKDDLYGKFEGNKLRKRHRVSDMTYQIQQVTTAEQLQQAFAVREEVFIVEQQVPAEIELDEYDHVSTTVHLLALDEAGKAVGTARFRPYNEEGVCKVERVAVLATTRGTGLGRLMMEEIHRLAREAGFKTAKLNAQLQAKPFYDRLGYIGEGETFLEADIEHMTMTKKLTA